MEEDDISVQFIVASAQVTGDLRWEEDEDEWELRGFGFRTSEFDSVWGKPFLWDFDPRLCKRLTQAEGYNVDAAAALPSVAFIRTHTSVAVRAMPAYTPNACATRACAAAAASNPGRKRKFSGQQRSNVAPPSALRTRARHQPS